MNAMISTVESLIVPVIMAAILAGIAVAVFNALVGKR